MAGRSENENDQTVIISKKKNLKTDNINIISCPTLIRPQDKICHVCHKAIHKLPKNYEEEKGSKLDRSE